MGKDNSISFITSASEGGDDPVVKIPRRLFGSLGIPRGAPVSVTVRPAHEEPVSEVLSGDCPCPRCGDATQVFRNSEGLWMSCRGCGRTFRVHDEEI